MERILNFLGFWVTKLASKRQPTLKNVCIVMDILYYIKNNNNNNHFFPLSSISKVSTNC